MASKSARFLSEADRARLLAEIGESAAPTAATTTANRDPERGASSQLLREDDDVFQGDGLEELVSALPHPYSSRFGEICWAQGGTGYGWWPSCIYDPRFTVGSTRNQSRKQLGRRHLVYFFQCDDSTPFDLLPDAKILTWTEGLAYGLHLGRSAKAAGRNRFQKFQEALQAAVVEEGKPQSRRLEWNHREGKGSHGMANLLPSPIQLVASAKRKARREKRERKRSREPAATGRSRRRNGARRTIDFAKEADPTQKPSGSKASEASGAGDPAAVVEPSAPRARPLARISIARSSPLAPTEIPWSEGGSGRGPQSSVASGCLK